MLLDLLPNLTRVCHSIRKARRLQVLQSTPGKLGLGAANQSVNPELICPPYILWPQRVRAGSDPSSLDPRPAVTRSQPSSPAARSVVARSQPSSRNLRRRRPGNTRRRPTLYPSSGVAYPSSPVFFKLPYLSSRVADLLSRVVDPSSRVADLSLRPFPCSPHTRPREPYKYAHVLLFPRTLLEHPGLHLPQRLHVGFSKGCFTFFIARHPLRLEFREYYAVHSALVNLDYIEIKHYFFFSLGLLALG